MSVDGFEHVLYLEGLIEVNEDLWDHFDLPATVAESASVQEKIAYLRELLEELEPPLM